MQTGKHLLRTQNVSKQNHKHFLCPGHKFCVRNKCCARGQRGNICVGNNLSSFARALIITSKNVVCRLNEFAKPEVETSLRTCAQVRLIGLPHRSTQVLCLHLFPAALVHPCVLPGSKSAYCPCCIVFRIFRYHLRQPGHLFLSVFGETVLSKPKPSCRRNLAS